MLEDARNRPRLIDSMTLLRIDSCSTTHPLPIPADVGDAVDGGVDGVVLHDGPERCALAHRPRVDAPRRVPSGRQGEAGAEKLRGGAG